MERHCVGQITQERRSTHHAGQNAALAFDAQAPFELRRLCDPADERFGLMSVQPVTDDMETA